jgi:hypothetical protein
MCIIFYSTALAFFCWQSVDHRYALFLDSILFLGSLYLALHSHHIILLTVTSFKIIFCVLKLNPGLCACQTTALSLSYIPSLKLLNSLFKFFLNSFKNRFDHSKSFSVLYPILELACQFFFLFGGIEVWTQGSGLTRWAFYHSSNVSNPFLSIST